MITPQSLHPPRDRYVFLILEKKPFGSVEVVSNRQILYQRMQDLGICKLPNGKTLDSYHKLARLFEKGFSFSFTAYTENGTGAGYEIIKAPLKRK